MCGTERGEGGEGGKGLLVGQGGREKKMCFEGRLKLRGL